MALAHHEIIINDMSTFLDLIQHQAQFIFAIKSELHYVTFDKEDGRFLYISKTVGRLYIFGHFSVIVLHLAI